MQIKYNESVIQSNGAPSAKSTSEAIKSRRKSLEEEAAASRFYYCSDKTDNHLSALLPLCGLCLNFASPKARCVLLNHDNKINPSYAHAQIERGREKAMSHDRYTPSIHIYAMTDRGEKWIERFSHLL